MNNLQIDYFLALCNNMNFTETAQQLYISQPALSKQISAMERDLEITLFDRNYRNLSLTPAGAYLREEMERIQSEIQAAANRAKHIHEQYKGQLTIGFLSGWNIACFIPNVANLLTEEQQETRLSLQSLPYNELLRSLAENSTDVIVATSSELDGIPGLDFYELGSVHARLFYSRSHPLAKKDSICFEDFSNQIFYVLTMQEFANAKQSITEHCAGYGFIPHTQTLPNIESMISSLQAGLGVTLFDTIHKLSTNPSFKSIDLPITETICAAWKKNNHNPNISALVKRLTLIEH
jgi:DNA-binding transcriptional LysR family regulator